MSEVERFLADIQQLFASNADKDEAKASAHRTLASFIGRAAVRGDEYAPLADVHGLLNEARHRLQGMSFEGEGRYLRVELLTELDQAIRATTPGRSS